MTLLEDIILNYGMDGVISWTVFAGFIVFGLQGASTQKVGTALYYAGTTFIVPTAFFFYTFYGLSVRGLVDTAEVEEAWKLFYLLIIMISFLGVGLYLIKWHNERKIRNILKSLIESEAEKNKS